MIKRFFHLIFLLFFIVLTISCEKDLSNNPVIEDPETGFVIIESNPVGYKIYIDDENNGKFTPDTLKYVMTGIHSVELKSDIYYDTSFTVDVVQDEVQLINMDVTASPYFFSQIFCNSNPANALIYLDDLSTEKRTPDTLYNVHPGDHTVKFVHDRCSEYSKNVFLKSGEVETIYKELSDTTVWFNYTPDNSSLPTFVITKLSCDLNETGDLWIGTTAGVIHYDGADFHLFNTENSPLPNNNITAIYAAREGFVFIGTSDGLLKYDDGATEKVF